MTKSDIERYVTSHFYTIILRRHFQGEGFIRQARDYCGDDEENIKYFAEICIEQLDRIRSHKPLITIILAICICLFNPLVDSDATRCRRRRERLDITRCL